MFAWKKCGVTYQGPSVPEAHGAKCQMPHGHDAAAPSKEFRMSDLARHWGWDERNGSHSPLGWYTAEQKKA